ncbi:hypothetical protein K438DRAFT_1417234, partial [Mycena galopus ATCC 62051]
GLAEFHQPDVEYHMRVGLPQYEPPEPLVSYTSSNYSLDLLSTGCVFAAMIFGNQHFFRGADNEDQLFNILRVLCTERFDAYLKAYDV